jgi:ribonucleotide monophosphatase NagD (HAD superfamily)
MTENEFKSTDVALVGDKNSDIDAGKSLGIRTYLVETGFGETEKFSTKADFIVPSLREAVHHLLRSWNYDVASSITGACQ